MCVAHRLDVGSICRLPRKPREDYGAKHALDRTRDEMLAFTRPLAVSQIDCITGARRKRFLLLKSRKRSFIYRPPLQVCLPLGCRISLRRLMQSLQLRATT